MNTSSESFGDNRCSKFNVMCYWIFSVILLIMRE